MANKRKINAQAKGHNGPIDFEVSIDNNQVTDLEIKQHSETPGIFNQVADKLRSDVLENQSFAIDAISGATVMSEAI
ncbi:FMN-binding protein [Tetragenococcus halophilus]|uniref:FMN-binding protein n=1 Tax=Tetragenococcus halophilus TaxID=51669 RepID=UPI001E35C345|nr:FMN-binding protein [Tetragenococcus halophilus]